MAMLSEPGGISSGLYSLCLNNHMFQLRYYSPDFYISVHQKILNVLVQIETVHGIRHEIFELRQLPSTDPNTHRVDNSHEKEIYQRDFRPRAGILAARIGESVKRLLRSRSGGYFVNGTVVITRNGQVEWFASYATPFKEYDDDSTLGFLKALLDYGQPLLEQLTPEIVRGQPELKILDAFINSGMLKGEFEREVKVGKKIFTAEGGTFDWRKSVDLVCKSGKETWILEGKRRLNYEALGEVLTYAVLYGEDHHGVAVKKGIVCGPLDDELLKACKFYEVTVFQVLGNDVRTYDAESP